MWNGASVEFYDSIATITGNTFDDIRAQFGSRLSLGDSITGTVSCDRTVITQSEGVCN